MSFFDTDFASVHAAVIAADFGESVSCRRANGTPITLTGVPRPVIYEVLSSEGGGLSTQVESWDWKFTAADLEELGGKLQPGDELLKTIGGVAFIFEVFEIGDRPACEWLDTAGLLLVVHTRKTKG